jgi:hypothetical protein
MSPAGGRGCVPTYDRALLRDRLPKKIRWQSPASGKGHADFFICVYRT